MDDFGTDFETDFGGVSFDCIDVHPDREKYWRFESMASESGWVSISPIYFLVYSRTPKGVRLVWSYEADNPDPPWKKLVIHSHNKKFAYPTKEEAWRAWLKRFESRKGYHQAEAYRIELLEKAVEKYNADKKVSEE